MASWRRPLTRRHSRNLPESRFRGVQCYGGPQGDVRGDMTCTEETPILTGNAMGTATPISVPVC